MQHRDLATLARFLRPVSSSATSSSRHRESNLTRQAVAVTGISPRVKHRNKKGASEGSEMRRRDERKLEETRFIPLPVTCRLQGLMTTVASPILPSLEPHILPAQRNENLLAFRAISSPGALPIIRIGHEIKRARYFRVSRWRKNRWICERWN